MSDPTASPETPSTVATPVADYSVSAAAGLRKNAAPKFELVRATQLKPCDKEEVPATDTESEPQTRRLLVFVTPEGQQVSRVCTANLFNVVEERRMDMIDDCDFYIFVDPKTKVAMRLEPVKRQDFLRGMIPTELEGVKLIEFDVDREHGFASIKRVPAKVDSELVLQIKLELDKATTLIPGSKLLGRYPIVEARSELGAALVTVNPFVK